MAHALSLTDGTTTISLTTKNCLLTHYVSAGPELDAATGSYKPVSEPVEFVIYDTTTALIQTKLNAIERLLYTCVQRVMTGTGPRLFLQFQAHNEAAAVRSEIFSYRLLLDDDSPVAFVQLKLGCRLVLTRAPFWEGARTAIALSNGNGTDVTTGLLVRNHDDATAGDDNWANIAAAAITGSLPAPLELRLANATGVERTYTNWHIANNLYGQALAHIIEGEASIGGYGTVGSDAACSGGGYTGQTGSGWLAFRWTIPAATLDLLKGRYVRVLARFRTLSTSDRDVRLRLYNYTGIAILGQSPQTIAEDGAVYFQDCGVLAFPATAFAAGWAQQVLELAVYAPTSETVEVDFIQLTPAEPMLYRKLIQRGFGMPNNDAVVDDGIEGLTYYEDGSTFLRYPIYVARSEPVYVWPGMDQRLLFLHDGAGQAISWAIAVKAWYRPRRSLL